MVWGIHGEVGTVRRLRFSARRRRTDISVTPPILARVSTRQIGYVPSASSLHPKSASWTTSNQRSNRHVVYN
jgi:hypothetical protein